MPQEITRIKEVPTKRSEFAKHYLNSDGSFTAEICSGPIHYKDGTWKDIDATVVTSDDIEYDFMNITNGAKTYFTKGISGTKANIKIVKDDVIILLKSAQSLKLSNASGAKSQETLAKAHPQKESKPNKIKFPSIYSSRTKKIDIDYDVLNAGIHEEFLVSEPMDFPEITQEITLINGYAKLNGKAINIYSKTTNKFVISIPEPVMFERGNPLKGNRDLHYEIFDLTKDTFTITKILDEKGKDWFFSSERVYPLIVDTDFVATVNYEIAGRDADYETSRSNAAQNTAGANYFKNGQMLYGTLYFNYRDFLKFDTSSITTDGTVTQVNLKLSVYYDSSDANYNVAIYKYDWSAYEPIDSYQRDVYTGVLSASADNNIWRNTDDISGDGTYSSGNLDTTWINKTGNTYYGLLSQNDYADGTAPTYNVPQIVYFWNETSSTVAYRPTLVVVYTVPALGPANLKSLNSNPKSNIKSISGNAIANIKTYNQIT